MLSAPYQQVIQIYLIKCKQSSNPNKIVNSAKAPPIPAARCLVCRPPLSSSSPEA